MLVVNLYGGPGSGKSTLAAGVFSLLKLQNINAELVTEFAKELVWDESLKVLECQEYVFGEQYRRLKRLEGKVDVAITDSPLLLSNIYGDPDNPDFHQLVLEKYREFDNLDVIVCRVKPFNPAGRLQNEGESRNLDKKISEWVRDHCDGWVRDVEGIHTGINMITSTVMSMLYKKPPRYYIGEFTHIGEDNPV